MREIALKERFNSFESTELSNEFIQFLNNGFFVQRR